MIAPGMFKINVSQIVSPILAYKPSCASNNVENKIKRKRRKRKSSKQNDKQVNNDVLRANRDFVHLDTVSSVRRPKHSGVIWKKKWSSNTSNVDLSSISHSKLNKDVKRYSRKDLLSCNNSHHVDTRSAYACNFLAKRLRLKTTDMSRSKFELVPGPGQRPLCSRRRSNKKAK
ncbi:hypothetical protein Tco_1464181 [Tanacetum coccineum]